MAISRVQSTKAGVGSGSTATTLSPAFSGNVTAGNMLVVVVRAGAFTPSSTPTVSDSRGTVYALAAATTSTNQDPKLWLFHGLAPSTGANTVSVTFPDDRGYRWVYALEYSGAHGLDVAHGKHTSPGSTSLVSNAFSTVAAESLVLLAASQNNFGTYTAGTSFTLVDGSIGAGSEFFGGVEEYITSSALTNYTAGITSSISNQYGLVLAAFSNVTSLSSGTGIVTGRPGRARELKHVTGARDLL